MSARSNWAVRARAWARNGCARKREIRPIVRARCAWEVEAGGRVRAGVHVPSHDRGRCGACLVMGGPETDIEFALSE